MEHNLIPSHWIKGQLLDLKRYGDGSYKATLMGEDEKLDQSNVMAFASGHDAQDFVSNWYQQSQQLR